MNTHRPRRDSIRNPRMRSAIAKTIEALEARSVQRQKADASEIKRTAAALRALRVPFEQLVSQDAKASRALQELSKHRFSGPADLPRKAQPKRGHVSTSVFSLQMQERLSVVIPPYDFEWQWGNPRQAIHQKKDGRIAILGASGAVAGGADGRVAAASGIGLVITTLKPSFVSVRPFIDYSWETVVGAAGIGAFGDATVGIDATVFVDGKFLDVPGVRRDEAFSDSRGTAGSDRNDGGAIAWTPALTLEFPLTPAQVAVVNFGAYVECDHSGGLFGSGAGAGKIQGFVKWIVVEQTILP